jgi:hypothetical protein
MRTATTEGVSRDYLAFPDCQRELRIGRVYRTQQQTPVRADY